MTLSTYTEIPREQGLRHGYTLDDIERLSRIAVNMAWPRAMDYRDRYDAAWHAVVEMLYDSEDPPSERDLKFVGAVAVNRLAQDHGQTWGIDRRNPDAGYEGMRGFQRYWFFNSGPTPSPENSVVDRVALNQIWPRLSPTHQQVLLAMAAHGDHVAAADAVGKTYTTFTTHLNNARRSFRQLWHEHETPARMWGKNDRRRGNLTAAQVLANRIHQRARRAQDDTPKPPKPPKTHCGNGHERTPENWSPAGRCRVCDRDRQRSYREGQAPAPVGAPAAGEIFREVA